MYRILPMTIEFDENYRLTRKRRKLNENVHLPLSHVVEWPHKYYIIEKKNISHTFCKRKFLLINYVSIFSSNIFHHHSHARFSIITANFFLFFESFNVCLFFMHSSKKFFSQKCLIVTVCEIL